MESRAHHSPIRRGVRRRLVSERGSAVILVVISLVLMMLIGAAYLQSARVQRFPLSEPRGDMDAQINAILAQIRQTLREDLNREPDRFALYDYPWTNTEDHGGVDTHPNYWEVTLFDGGPDAARGGARDSAWLASMEPDFNGAAPVWPHLTNLRGVFLAYDRENNTFLDPDTDEGQHVLDHVENVALSHTAEERTNMNLPFNDGSPLANLLIDATGDGIPDSRWTWAPITTIDGIDYVMAVRIVDLSGMVNVNTALSLGYDDGGIYKYDETPEGTDAPRWGFPSELDLGRFVYDTSDSGFAASHLEDVERALIYRGVTVFSDDMPLVPWTPDADDTWRTRQDFWLEQGRFTGTGPYAGYNRFGLDSEYELRRRGGLSKHPDDGGRTVTLESADRGMPAFLRAVPGATESAWHGVDMSRYGGQASPDPANDDHLRDFFQLEPRHQMTTRSGAAIFSWPVLDEFGDAEPFGDNEYFTAPENSLGLDGWHIKTDLNEADPDRIADVIERVYTQGTPTLPGGLNLGDFVSQLTANMIAYRDDDNRLPKYNGRYGLEALPFLAEIYAQRPYVAQTVRDETSDPPAPAGEIIVEWVAEGPAGFAIEVVNPFRKPIDLTDVELLVNGDVVNTLDALAGGDVDAHNQAQNGTDSGDRRLHPDDVLILYRDSSGGNGNDDVTALFTDEGGTLIAVDLSGAGVTWPTDAWTSGTPGNPPTPAQIDVELRATTYDVADPTSTGGLVYSRGRSISLPDTYEDGRDAADPSNPAENDRGYWQDARIGNGAGLNPMLISAGNWFRNESEAHAPYEDQSTDFVALGKEDKTVAGGPADELAPNEAQIVIRDDDLHHAGELVYLTVLAPTDAQTVAEVFTGASSIEEYMLDFTPSADNIADDNYNVPHAVFLLDQLTTLSPRVDGEDNAGDGQIDSTRDNIVPGLVNLNTMPEHLLAKVLPLPETPAIDWDTDGTTRTLREEVAWRIVRYRGDAALEDYANGITGAIAQQRADLVSAITGSGTTPDFREAPGIAHTGELFMLFSDMLTTNWNDDDPTWPDFSGDVSDINGTRVDFLSNPDGTSGDGIANDREEAMMIAKWLAQVGSTRSDYFVAYVLVRGYDGGWTGSDVVEAARFIAIFERNAAEGDVTVQAVFPPGVRPYMVN